jgi:hypothetical protein
MAQKVPRNIVISVTAQTRGILEPKEIPKTEKRGRETTPARVCCPVEDGLDRYVSYLILAAQPTRAETKPLTTQPIPLVITAPTTLAAAQRPIEPEATAILIKLARERVSMLLAVLTLAALWVLMVAVMVVLLIIWFVQFLGFIQLTAYKPVTAEK